MGCVKIVIVFVDIFVLCECLCVGCEIFVIIFDDQVFDIMFVKLDCQCLVSYVFFDNVDFGGQFFGNVIVVEILNLICIYL